MWIHRSKPVKGLKITPLVRFFKSLAYKITVYSVHYQQFNKNGLQNKLWLATFLRNSSELLNINVRIR